jgi:ATP-dependent DNA helicase DinG
MILNSLRDARHSNRKASLENERMNPESKSGKAPRALERGAKPRHGDRPEPELSEPPEPIVSFPLDEAGSRRGAPSGSGSNSSPPGLQLSLHQFFGPGGLLSRSHPAYEFRRGQLQMAQAVELALQEKRHLIVEAGTGTGKTLAYLVPALRSGKRVIISTATKALQEQLFYKDVPFLQTAIFPNGERTLQVCYMKGRNNYLCRKKLYDLARQPVLEGLEEIEEFRVIASWEKSTETGDRAELAGLPENSRLWEKLDARTEACIGQKCSEFQRCFITEMRRRAAESDVIIVNHHLFFADLAIKQATEDSVPDAGVLPDCGAVVFDEAHELEDVATSYFGISLSNFRVEDLLRDVEACLRQKKLDGRRLLAAGHALRDRAQAFFSVLPPGEGRFEFAERRQFLEEHGGEYLELQRALERLRAELNAMEDKPDEAYNLARRVGELLAQLSFVLESQDRNTVFWIERRGAPSAPRKKSGEGLGRSSRVVFLQATPIDVSQILRQALFEPFDTAVLASATLAVNGGYEYVKRRLGVDYARELVVPSHFDYGGQALLYVAPELPDPRLPEFTGRATETIRSVLRITQGRAFCLFTSYAQMHTIYDRLAGELPFPLLLQGQAPRSALLEEFRSTPNCVLFATSSFWQGVDVQGEQLSCVIIDRLPFAVPNDPVVAARVRAILEEGGNAFYEYQVPSAVIALKQGFGRLIRSLNDRGALVLLDNRILKKPYGRMFFNSLPDYRRTDDLAEVERFFAR